ncbi:MAG: PepSY domain-containing protein [Sphingomonas sp.]|nr:PepSY domain-containing protein [Sphingomonas sp.]
MTSARTRLRRWHLWLGWIVGLPILFWVVSGLVMVARPIEEVRGTHLLKSPPPLQLRSAPRAPPLGQAPVASLALEQRAAGPRWVVQMEDGASRLADPATGEWLPPLAARDAAREVLARYAGTSTLANVNRVDPNKPPLDFRRPVAAWQVRMADGTNFYVEAGSGEIAATRTRFWRVFDWMWGLHIMDLKTREDTHNPLVITFGVIALVTTLLALALLPMTLRRRRRPGRASE